MTATMSNIGEKVTLTTTHTHTPPVMTATMSNNNKEDNSTRTPEQIVEDLNNRYSGWEGWNKYNELSKSKHIIKNNEKEKKKMVAINRGSPERGDAEIYISELEELKSDWRTYTSRKLKELKETVDTSKHTSAENMSREVPGEDVLQDDRVHLIKIISSVINRYRDLTNGTSSVELVNLPIIVKKPPKMSLEKLNQMDNQILTTEEKEKEKDSAIVKSFFGDKRNKRIASEINKKYIVASNSKNKDERLNKLLEIISILNANPIFGEKGEISTQKMFYDMIIKYQNRNKNQDKAHFSQRPPIVRLSQMNSYGPGGI
jgi:hypothetical protein